MVTLHAIINNHNYIRQYTSSVIGYQSVSTSGDPWVGLAGTSLGRPCAPLKPVHGVGVTLIKLMGRTKSLKYVITRRSKNWS